MELTHLAEAIAREWPIIAMIGTGAAEAVGADMLRAAVALIRRWPADRRPTPNEALAVVNEVVAASDDIGSDELRSLVQEATEISARQHININRAGKNSTFTQARDISAQGDVYIGPE